MVIDVNNPRLLRSFARALPGFLQRQRWFGGKAKPIMACEVLDAVTIGNEPEALWVFLIRVEFADGHPQIYVLPLQQILNVSGGQALETAGIALKIELENPEGESELIFVDAPRQPGFPAVMLDIIRQSGRFRGTSGELVGLPTSAFERLRGTDRDLDALPVGVEQSNTSIVFGKRLILKIFRQTEEGVNPEIEICSFLTERTSFTNIAAVAGAIEYRRSGAPPMSVGVLQAFVPNQGDAWKFTLGELDRYFDRLPGGMAIDSLPPTGSLLALSRNEAPSTAAVLIGNYLQSAEVLGRRTAELHVALGSESHDPDFTPEPFTLEYQRSMYASLMGLIQQNLGLLRDRQQDLPVEDRELARLLLDREDELRSGLSKVVDRKIAALRTRVHGDYHLGQVLHTGSDFVIIDFEGEPARPLLERRMKGSPLKDVAGMLRSFHYAVHTAVFRRVSDRNHSIGQNDLSIAARYWQAYVSAAFLKSYLRAANSGSFLPKEQDDLRMLLEMCLLEKAVYELGYELNNRPTWVGIPLRGILQTVADQNATTAA